MPDVDVLIVGGGPVGLTARVLLARWGVRTLLVEKHRELSPFPRSRLLNVRSMEIFRQLGIDTAVAARAFAPEYGRVRWADGDGTLLVRPDGHICARWDKGPRGADEFLQAQLTISELGLVQNPAV